MLGIDEASPVLLHVARIVEGKGHGDLVPLMRDVRRHFPDVRMLVVGTGDLEEAFRRGLAREGLDDAVRLLGRRDDVPALLAAADVLVFPSRSEGMGLVVLEAMASGLPVVAYALPAFEEFARDGDTGIFAPVGVREDLTKAVLELLGDEARRAAMGRAGRVTVAERFRWPNAAAVLAGVYEQVVAMRGSR
ncbi:glycosyltransferase family 4 protein [Actinopolymorpha pittospori]